VSCNGNWGAPQEVFVDTTGARVQSLAITQNELALFYAYGDDDEVLVSSRSSIDDPFGPGTPVPELTAPCSGDQETLFDVSEDALDAYVACAPWNLDCATAPCTVQHASRASTSQPFVGQGVVASTVGSSPAVAGNGLALYTNALDPYADSAVPLFATRPSTSHPFAAAQAIPGARAWTRALLGPEVSPDQLEIYGAELPYADAIVVSQRSNQSDPFPDPIAIPLAVVADVVGSPDLSADCRALYFVAVTEQVRTVYVARR
jgi:hypothetical protein